MTNPLPRRSWVRATVRRQDKLKGRPVIRIGRAPQPTLIRLDNRSGDRKPHTQSVWLRRIQGLEEALDVSLLESNPGVPHRDQHTSAGAHLVSLRADDQLPIPVR